MFVLLVLQKKEGTEGNIHAGHFKINIDWHILSGGKDYTNNDFRTGAIVSTGIAVQSARGGLFYVY
jgi:hypothetical protein